MDFFTKKATAKSLPLKRATQKDATAVSSPSRVRSDHQEESVEVSTFNSPFQFYEQAAAKIQAKKLSRKQCSEAEKLVALEEGKGPGASAPQRPNELSKSTERKFLIPETLRPLTAYSYSESASSGSMPHTFYEQQRKRVAERQSRKSENSRQTSESECQVDVSALMPTDEPWTSILTSDIVKDIVYCLPSWIRFHPWRLVYSPKAHGVSMRTFFRQQAGPNVVLVRDAQGQIFGGFAAQAWFPAPHGYGEIQSFVFKVEASPKLSSSESPMSPLSGGSSSPSSWGSPEKDGSSDSQLQHFQCSMNSGGVIQWACDDMIALGSAFVVRDGFLNGSSSACATFQSPPLSSLGTDFVISDFECWAIGET